MRIRLSQFVEPRMKTNFGNFHFIIVSWIYDSDSLSYREIEEYQLKYRTKFAVKFCGGNKFYLNSSTPIFVDLCRLQFRILKWDKVTLHVFHFFNHLTDSKSLSNNLLTCF